MTEQEETTHSEPPAAPVATDRPNRLIPIAITAGVIGVLALGGLLVRRAEAGRNDVALASAPKPVTATPALESTFRPTRVYVGTLRPWVEASVGPQLISAYVDTVLVRPGSVVKRGDVLATLDCRNAGAGSQAISATARAIEARQKAMASEAARVQGLLDGGFVSANEAEQKLAQSSSGQAQLEAQRAELAKSSLEVSDCVLRAPFDGEVSRRMVDPGAFARPGTSVVALVDRNTLRMTADAPEDDFEVVAPGTHATVHVLATGANLTASVARRAPSADPGTRTIHFELDIADPERGIPTDTTGEVRIEVGVPLATSEVPIFATSTNGEKATLFVLEGDVARSRTLRVRGERGGSLFFDPKDLPSGTPVVTEGRALLADGDKVTARVEAQKATGSGAAVQGKPQ